MSDLTFGPSFKVKRWFTGFGELSFRWIQICIGSLMRRSSFILHTSLKAFADLNFEFMHISYSLKAALSLCFRLIYGAQGLLKRELNQQKDKWKRPAKDGDKVRILCWQCSFTQNISLYNCYFVTLYSLSGFPQWLSYIHRDSLVLNMFA